MVMADGPAAGSCRLAAEPTGSYHGPLWLVATTAVHVDPYDYGRSYLLTPIVLLSNIILVTIGNIHLSMLLND